MEKNKYFLEKGVYFFIFALYTVLQQKYKKQNCSIKRRVTQMSLKSPMEFFRTLPKKTCPECGEKMEEQAESYFMECERCLSKKGE